MDAKTAKLDLECAQRFDAGQGRPELFACVWLAQIPVPCGRMYRIIRREDGNRRLSSRRTGIWSDRAGRLGDRGKGTRLLRFPVSTSILVLKYGTGPLVLAVMLPKVLCGLQSDNDVLWEPVAAWSVASSDSDSGQGPPCEEAGQLGPHCTATTRREQEQKCLSGPDGGVHGGTPVSSLQPRFCGLGL